MIVPMTTAYAAQIAGWTYAGDYAIYSFSHDDEALRELMNGEYFARLDANRRLSGYFCFGNSARIPAVEPDAYTSAMPDIGLGMKPALCGKGNGAAFVREGLDFALDRFRVRQYRLTVAAWNTRAIRTYAKLGFRHTGTITHRKTQQPFHIMTYIDQSEENTAMFRYAHTNIVAKDAPKLIAFYKSVLHCRSIGETRDLRGEWLNKLTGLTDAHITGEHLLLPGYGGDHPTLEIFQYDKPAEDLPSAIHRPGIAHLAFEVDDVDAVLDAVLAAGGSTVGERIAAAYADGRTLHAVYARDPEGNILELQSWA